MGLRKTTKGKAAEAAELVGAALVVKEFLGDVKDLIEGTGDFVKAIGEKLEADKDARREARHGKISRAMNSEGFKSLQAAIEEAKAALKQASISCNPKDESASHTFDIEEEEEGWSVSSHSSANSESSEETTYDPQLDENFAAPHNHDPQWTQEDSTMGFDPSLQAFHNAQAFHLPQGFFPNTTGSNQYHQDTTRNYTPNF